MIPFERGKSHKGTRRPQKASEVGFVNLVSKKNLVSRTEKLKRLQTFFSSYSNLKIALRSKFLNFHVIICVCLKLLNYSGKPYNTILRAHFEAWSWIFGFFITWKESVQNDPSISPWYL